MTREEYQSHTGIKSAEEARQHMVNLRVFFVSVFVTMVGLRMFAHTIALANHSLYLFLWLAYVVLLVCFVAYCVKVTNLTRDVTEASPALSILFAPISWIWFYPALLRPLKIIMGEIEPPASLRPPADRVEIAKANRKFWKKFLIATTLILAVFMVTLVILMFVAQHS